MGVLSRRGKDERRVAERTPRHWVKRDRYPTSPPSESIDDSLGIGELLSREQERLELAKLLREIDDFSATFKRTAGERRGS